MLKVIKYEIKSKFKFVLAGALALFVFLSFKGSDYGLGLGLGFYGSSLDLYELSRSLRGVNLRLWESLVWLINFTSLINFYQARKQELNYLLPLARGQLLLGHLATSFLIYLLMGLVFILAGPRGDGTSYWALAYIGLTGLVNLTIMESILGLVTPFIDSAFNVFTIILLLIVESRLFQLGSLIFYEKNVRFNLNFMTFQSLIYVDQVNGNIYGERILNQGLDLASLGLGLVLASMFLALAYKKMEGRSRSHA